MGGTGFGSSPGDRRWAVARQELDDPVPELFNQTDLGCQSPGQGDYGLDDYAQIYGPAPVPVSVDGCAVGPVMSISDWIRAFVTVAVPILNIVMIVRWIRSPSSNPNLRTLCLAALICAGTAIIFVSLCALLIFLSAGGPTALS